MEQFNYYCFMIPSVMSKKNIDLRAELKVQELSTIDFDEKDNGLNKKWHSFLIIYGGSGVLQIDFEEHIALKGKIFFIEKFEFWKYLKNDNLSGLMVQFTDSFYNSIYTGNPKIKSDNSLLGNATPFIIIDEENKLEWMHIFEIIQKEFLHNKENSKEIICLSLKILTLMYRRDNSCKNVRIESDRKKRLLMEFNKLVNNKFYEIKTPKQFALLLNITPNYLNALCKEIYYKTASEIIQDRLVLEAKRLLAHTGLSASEIGYKLGFHDNSYFGRYFKKAVGISPEKYRNANINSLNV